jgi:glyoxylase-like metal-dependent hydrolase (beta-lactamase superfamily II)
MPSSFYGLRLPRHGESFLLRTVHSDHEHAILVDAGYGAESGLSPLYQELIAQFPSLTTINRFTCTHEDSDHCGGAPDFLRDWINAKRSVGEVLRTLNRRHGKMKGERT